MRLVNNPIEIPDINMIAYYIRVIEIKIYEKTLDKQTNVLYNGN